MVLKRRKISREFKLSIVTQFNAGRPAEELARENDLHTNLIYRWKQEYSKDPERAFGGNGNAYKDQARIAQLERMVGQLYAENEFLKKALSRLGKKQQEERMIPIRGGDTR